MTGPAATEQHLRARLAGLPPEQRAQLVERLRTNRLSPRTAPKWIVRQGSRDPALRLFCFSYAGGGTSAFRAWSDHLPEHVEVCAVALPGRESRSAEEPYRRLRPLVTDLQAAILPLLDRPFAMFGHSMGALVAFELTRELRRVGAPQPEQLFLAAFRAPQLPNPNIRIYHLPDEVLKTVLAKEGTPRDILNDAELMRVLMPTLRADFELCDTYEYSAESPISVPMVIFGGLHDVRVGRADLAHWKAQGTSDFSLTMLPGAHLFIHDCQDLLLAQLNERLESTITSPRGTPA